MFIKTLTDKTRALTRFECAYLLCTRDRMSYNILFEVFAKFSANNSKLVSIEREFSKIINMYNSSGFDIAILFISSLKSSLFISPFARVISPAEKKKGGHGTPASQCIECSPRHSQFRRALFDAYRSGA